MQNANLESLYPDTAHEKEIAQVANFIKDGTSCQLLSIPGAGRSTILGLLAHNSKVRLRHFGASSHVHFVPVHFSEVKKRPLFDVMKFLFLSLADSLRERKMTEYGKINDLFKKSLAFHDELVLFQALKEGIDYLALEKKFRIVFLFDRFEEYAPAVTSEFFTNLRTLRNRAKYQFCVVFSSNRPLEDFLDQDQLADFYEFIEGHYIFTDLYDKATTDFRVEYVEKLTGKKIPLQVLNNIIEVTGGVGRLIKLSVETFLSQDSSNVPSNKKNDKTFDFEKSSKEKLAGFLFSQKLIQSALKEICRSLLPSEQAYLINKKQESEQAKLYLEKIGIIKDPTSPSLPDEQAGLRGASGIQIPLFEMHINSHAEEGWGTTKKIEYDLNTNTIKMDESVLSDQLTSSEFKLLKYLLQNTDKVVERDTIISVVWSSVKSTAGITDQAVDQLIFRLRRKIEEDPNNPVHLLTVKGRGFRFIT